MDPVTGLMFGSMALNTAASLIPNKKVKESMSFYNSGNKYGGYRGGGAGTTLTKKNFEYEKAPEIKSILSGLGQAAGVAGQVWGIGRGMKNNVTPVDNVGSAVGNSYKVELPGVEEIQTIASPAPQKQTNTQNTIYQNSGPGINVTGKPFGKPQHWRTPDFEETLNRLGSEILGSRWGEQAKRNLLTQIDLEQGKRGFLASYHNYAGMKDYKGRSQFYVNAKDPGDGPARWFAFQTAEDGLRAYLNLYAKSPRYAGINLNADPYEFGTAVGKAGWATDPRYGSNIADRYSTRYLSGSLINGGR